MQIIDITIPLSEKTPVWEGDQGVKIRQVSFTDNGADFNISRTEFGVHAGTHIDAPFHLFSQGKTVDTIPLDILIGDAVVLKIDPSYDVIDVKTLQACGFLPGTQRLILKTRNTDYWVNDPYGFNRDFMGINTDGAEYLVEQEVQLVGIDYFSASPISDLKKPHEIMLEAGIVILENTYLVNVKPGAYHLICLPLKLIGTDGAPVRAVLTKD